MAETLTILHLDVPLTLARTLRSTNPKFHDDRGILRHVPAKRCQAQPRSVNQRPCLSSQLERIVNAGFRWRAGPGIGRIGG
jgi:hypothetical protein